MARLYQAVEDVLSYAPLGGRIELNSVVYEWAFVRRNEGTLWYSENGKKFTNIIAFEQTNPDFRDFILKRAAERRQRQKDGSVELERATTAVRTCEEIDDNLNDDIQELIYDYRHFIRHGSTKIADIVVSWHIDFNELFQKATICYQWGHNTEWEDDCYPESVPKSLLRYLLKQIQSYVRGNAREYDVIARGMQGAEVSEEPAFDLFIDDTWRHPQ
ncbi:MAG: hypothetical protein WCE82_10640 [Halobacteriota archaeon]